MSEFTFDLHASVKRLAKAVLPCDQPYPDMLPRVYAPNCKIVPFATLRVKCSHRRTSPLTSPWQRYVTCLDCEAENIEGHWRDHHSWVPEPDLERACWRVWKILDKVPKGLVWYIGVARLAAYGKTYAPPWNAEEAMLRAAEAWLGENYRAMKEEQDNE